MKYGLVLVSIVLLLAACTTPSEQFAKQAGPTQWECIQYECAQQQTGLEWAEANCELNENGTTMCPVEYQGQQGMIAASDLNLNNITTCAQYRCVQEAPTRSVNYTVNETPTQI